MIRLPVLLAAAAACAGATERPGLRVTTWNLGLAGNSPTVQEELDRLAERSDALALQEIYQPGDPDPIKAWASRRGWSYRSKHSNAIATRWPIVRAGTIAANPAWSRDLPWVEIESPDRHRFRVYSVHLSFKHGLNPFIGVARGVESARLARDARGFDGPVVLAGDFNSIGRVLWGHASEPGLSLLRKWGYQDATRTLPGHTHSLGRLDWIYTLGLDASEAERGRSLASDHRWLWASLSRRPKASGLTGETPRYTGRPALAAVLLAGLAAALFGLFRRSRSERGPARPA